MLKNHQDVAASKAWSHPNKKLEMNLQKGMELTFSQHLMYTKQFTCIIALNLQAALWGGF